MATTYKIAQLDCELEAYALEEWGGDRVVTTRVDSHDLHNAVVWIRGYRVVLRVPEHLTDDRSSLEAQFPELKQNV